MGALAYHGKVKWKGLQSVQGGSVGGMATDDHMNPVCSVRR